MGGQHNYGRMHVLFTIVPVQQSHRVVSPLKVVYEHVSCLYAYIIYCMCACAVSFFGSLTHARALSVAIPDIGYSMASYEEVHQTLAENTDNI